MRVYFFFLLEKQQHRSYRLSRKIANYLCWEWDKNSARNEKGPKYVHTRVPRRKKWVGWEEWNPLNVRHATWAGQMEGEGSASMKSMKTVRQWAEAKLGLEEERDLPVERTGPSLRNRSGRETHCSVIVCDLPAFPISTWQVFSGTVAFRILTTLYFILSCFSKLFTKWYVCLQQKAKNPQATIQKACD